MLLTYLHHDLTRTRSVDHGSLGVFVVVLNEIGQSSEDCFSVFFRVYAESPPDWLTGVSLQSEFGGNTELGRQR